MVLSSPSLWWRELTQQLPRLLPMTDVRVAHQREYTGHFFTLLRTLCAWKLIVYVSGVLHLIFWERGYLWVTKTPENETVDKGGILFPPCCLTQAQLWRCARFPTKPEPSGLIQKRSLPCLLTVLKTVCILILLDQFPVKQSEWPEHKLLAPYGRSEFLQTYRINLSLSCFPCLHPSVPQSLSTPFRLQVLSQALFPIWTALPRNPLWAEFCLRPQPQSLGRAARLQTWSWCSLRCPCYSSYRALCRSLKAEILSVSTYFFLVVSPVPSLLSVT